MGITELAELVRAGLDEDERIAVAAHEKDPAPWTTDIAPAGSLWDAGMLVDANGKDLWDCEGAYSLCMSDTAAIHAARHDPARVLRNAARDRALLDHVLSWPHEVTRTSTAVMYCATVDKPDAGYDCDCGRDERVQAVLTLLAAPYQEAGRG